MVKRIELLVHAGAPSGRKDDETYRTQAAAHLDFQAKRTTKVATFTPDPLSSTQRSSGERREIHDATTTDEPPAAFLNDTQLAITGLDSQLFTSSLPLPRDDVPAGCTSVNLSTPKAAVTSGPATRALDDKPVSQESVLAQTSSLGKRKHTERSDGDRLRDAVPEKVLTGDEEMVFTNTAPSRVSSEAPSLSSYLKTPVLDRSVKEPRLVGKPADTAVVSSPYVALPDAVQRGLALVDPRIVQDAPPATAPAAVARSQNSLEASEPTSELPTSYSLSDITSESSRARISISQRSVKAPQALGKGGSSSSGKGDASTVSPSTGSCSVSRNEGPALGSRPSANLGVEKQVTVVADDMQDETDNTTNSAKAPASRTPRKAATGTNAPASPLIAQKESATSKMTPEDVTAARSDILQRLYKLPTTIYPPEPATSTDNFGTHLTPGLFALSSNSATSDRYQPVRLIRVPRPHERGHWRLDPSTWSLETQVIFWEFMERAIGSGSPGWGVWCTRENDGQRKIPTDGEGAAHGLGPVRVYCWGEVVREVWLLLYVASRSQARKVGMSWVDAEGDVVVQMKRA